MNTVRKGTNAAVMKEYNRKLILDMVHRGHLSRAEIAKRSGLTKATVTILTEELICEGIIREKPAKNYSGVGRNPLKLYLCKESLYIFGFALSRKGYHAGLFNLAGEALESGYFLYEETCDKSVEAMAEHVRDYMKNANVKTVLGIGVASPGPVDYIEGKILQPPNFEKWHNYPIGKKLKEYLDIPVFLENIANAMVINQKYFGSCRIDENYAYILVDEGIGSGIMTEGQVYRGKSGHGNELGHTSIKFDGIPCTCGNIGCLECYASIPAILKDTPYKSWTEAVDAGDVNLIKKEADFLACAIVNLINLFDLEKIILGNDVSYKSEKIIKYLTPVVEKRKITDNIVNIIADTSSPKPALAAASIATHNTMF